MHKIVKNHSPKRSDTDSQAASSIDRPRVVARINYSSAEKIKLVTMAHAKVKNENCDVSS